MLLAGCDNYPHSSRTNNDQPSKEPTINSQPIVPSGTEQVDYCMPTVKEDYWELLCENCDITVYLDNTRENFLMFPLLSVQEPAGKIMTISTDLGTTAEVEIYKEGDAIEFPFSTFMMYQNFDWESLDTDAQTQSQILKSWHEKYQDALNDLPMLYSYRFYIPLDRVGVDITSSEPQQIKTLTVTMDGQTKTYELGNVSFLPGRLNANTSSAGGLSIPPLISGYSTSVSENGILALPSIDVSAKKDVVLQGITIPGYDDITIASCNVTITTPSGDCFNMQWDANSPLEVDEGTKIQIELMLVDPALANTALANIVRYISLDYTNDGDVYSALTFLSCRILVQPHDIYALKVDGIDMLPYYFTYKNYSQE